MSSVRRAFRESPKDFRPVPWWVWTGDMTRDSMDRRLLAMREQGIYEFFIFAMSGLEVEFNSLGYFDLVEHVLERCHEWGMRAWIYDDYNWPSGTCAGSILRDYPWARSHLIEYEIVRVAPGEMVEAATRGDSLGAYLASAEGTYSALAGHCSTGPDGVVRSRWINDRDEPGWLISFCLVPYEELLPSAFGATWALNQRGYLDVLNPDAVALFIERCYEPYARRFSRYLGREIVGFFTDEPALNSEDRQSGPPLPYTQRLWELFAERYGYRLEGRLPELVAEVGSWAKTRYDYWHLVSDLFAKSYVGQIQDWCAKHGVKFTGHFLGEETVRDSVRWSGGIHRAARLMSVPGIDLLREFTSYDTGADGGWYGPDLKVLNTTAKVVASAADLAGAERRMAEAYGIVDWDQSPAQMKRTVDWLAALGLNLINDNCLMHSLQGFRKRMSAGKGFTTPWFDSYRRFAEHVGRVCWMTTIGQAVDAVGVLYPTASAWTLFGAMLPGSLESTLWPRMEKALAETGDALNRIQRPWRFVYDEELASAVVHEGVLHINNLSFTSIILPALPVITEPVCGKLRQFAESGGTILVVGGAPSLTPDPDWDVGGEVAALQAQGGVLSLPEPEWGSTYELWLDERLPRAAVSFSGPGRRQVLVAHRRDEQHEYLFITNQAGQPAHLTLSSAVEGTWERWDPDTGEQWALDTGPRAAERTWSTTLAPWESVFVVICRRGAAAQRSLGPSLASRQVTTRQPLIGPWQFERLAPNTLLLDVAVRADPSGEGLDRGWQEGGREEWLPARDGWTEIALDPDECPWFWERAELDLACVPADLELVVDSHDHGEVFVNGRQVRGGRATCVWDEQNWAYPLGEHVRRGRNLVVLRCRPSRYYSRAVRGTLIDPHCLEPLVVRGTFSVLRAADGHHVVAPETGEIRLGPWESQGYPTYCGAGVYRRSIELPDRWGRCWLVLEDVRHVAEVEINGRDAGARLWAPYEFDLTRHVRPGRNELAVRVSNGLGRLLRRSYLGPIGHEVLSGIVGRAWLAITQV